MNKFFYDINKRSYDNINICSNFKFKVFQENLGSHNSESIKDKRARLVSIHFSQLVLPAY